MRLASSVTLRGWPGDGQMECCSFSLHGNWCADACVPGLDSFIAVRVVRGLRAQPRQGGGLVGDLAPLLAVLLELVLTIASLRASRA